MDIKHQQLGEQIVQSDAMLTQVVWTVLPTTIPRRLALVDWDARIPLSHITCDALMPEQGRNRTRDVNVVVSVYLHQSIVLSHLRLVSWWISIKADNSARL